MSGPQAEESSKFWWISEPRPAGHVAAPHSQPVPRFPIIDHNQEPADGRKESENGEGTVDNEHTGEFPSASESDVSEAITQTGTGRAAHSKWSPFHSFPSSWFNLMSFSPPSWSMQIPPQRCETARGIFVPLTINGKYNDPDGEGKT